MIKGDFHGFVRAEKATAGWLSQDDTLYHAARLFGLTEVRDLLRERYRFLLIDEYQDPLTLFGVIAVLVLISLSACYLPARRATLVDPYVALRGE